MATNYNPETLHGTHYTETDFDAEVESRLNYELNRRNEQHIDEDEKENWRFNLRRDVYKEWNNCDSDQLLRFEMNNSLKYTGVQTSGFIKETGDDNPYLQPVHGISLKDYCAMVLKMTQGVPEVTILTAMGIDNAIWDELNTIWPQRMGQDTSFTVTTLYGQYFAESVTHPKLEALKTNTSEAGNENLERLKNDIYFYEELNGARTAAYQYGLDGAQWILDNYGITLGDFQSVAMQHLTARNQSWSSEDILHYSNYMQEKQAEYAEKFASEQGGNVADDVDF